MNKHLPTLALGALLLAACQATPPADGGSSSSPAAMMQDEVMMDASTFTKSSVSVNKTTSTITFVGGSSIVDHPGAFKTFDVTVALDSAEPQNLEKAQITASIDIASVKTDSERLDGHFQKEDFFDAAKFPTATFRSTSIVREDGDTYAVMGDLTMKGVTKSVTMEAVIDDDGLVGMFNIPRKDFAIAKDTYGEKLLDEDVPVSVNLKFE